MEEKNKMIENYIMNISEQINKQYNGLMTEERITRAIEMFKDSESSYEEIVAQINTLAESVVNNYIEQMKKRFDPELVKENHKEIYDKLEILVRKLNEAGVDYQLAGALCSYIKYGVESERTHDDIDINLNEVDMDKFKKVCGEMGLQFQDNRLTSPRVLKRGIPSGEHEVIATLDGSEFHIGAFCFERKPDGSIINKGYYHDENNNPCSRNDIISPKLATEIFGREAVEFRGQTLYITPPEYIYKLKSYTQNDKDKADLQFMADKIDRDKLSRINVLSSTSKTELVRVTELPKTNTSTSIVQSFNYHTHTYRSGHGEYCSDKEIVESARANGIMQLGFSEHIPNPSLILPDEDHRMLSSEVDEYLSSINNLKSQYPDMTILVGFEAEFDPMKESYLGEMRNKVDYMILGQHFVSRGLGLVQANGNPNYPIEYANIVVKAIESGLFDIVAHPDIFMEFRDTMKDEQARQLFEENSIIASQIICEKARDMGIPIEINYGAISKGQMLSDGLAYPYSTFWKVASEIDGLQVIRGIDAHDLRALEEFGKENEHISKIEQLVGDKIIDGAYNPAKARENNPRLQEAFNKKQANALTYETHMVSCIVNGSLTSLEDGLDSESLAVGIASNLNATMQSCVNQASQKDKAMVDEISSISESTDISLKDKKGKLSRKKLAMEETNQVLANQQRVIESARANVVNAMNIGCETKSEFSNMMTQITEHGTTKNGSSKSQLEEHITGFQQSKGISNDYSIKKEQSYQLKKVKNDSTTSSSQNGFINAVTLSLIVTFVIGIAVGIGYMLYRISIG